MNIKRLSRIVDSNNDTEGGRVKDDASTRDILRYRINVDEIVNYLNRALAEEFQAWYQYWIVAPFLFGNERKNIEDLFYHNADDELNDHAKKLIDRLNELGANGTFLQTPDEWKFNAVAKFLPANGDFSVENNLTLNIVGEVQAIQTYTVLCDMTRGLDYKTYTISKSILDDEQEHLQDLLDFAKDLGMSIQPEFLEVAKMQVSDSLEELKPLVDKAVLMGKETLSILEKALSK